MGRSRERDGHQKGRQVPEPGADLARPTPEHPVGQRQEAVDRDGHGGKGGHRGHHVGRAVDAVGVSEGEPRPCR